MKNKIVTILLSTLLVVSVAGNIYLLSNRKSLDNSITVITSELNQLKETILEKDSSLTDAKNQIGELEDIISDLQKELEDTKKSLETTEAEKQELEQKNSITEKNSDTRDSRDTKTEPQQPQPKTEQQTNNNNQQQQTNNNTNNQQPSNNTTPVQDTPSAGGIEQGNLGGDNGFAGVIGGGGTPSSDWLGTGNNTPGH